HRLGRAILIDGVDDERGRRLTVFIDAVRKRGAVDDVVPYPQEHAAHLGVREEVDRPLLLVPEHFGGERGEDEEEHPKDRQRDDDLQQRVTPRVAWPHHRLLPPVSARMMARCCSCPTGQRMVSVMLRTSARGVSTFTVVV